MTTFKNLFSEFANNYAKYRPDYPKELFTYLASLTDQHDLAWDCATGNGQAALALTKFYQKVIASDASQTQIDNAKNHPKIEYHAWPADKTPLGDKSLDLITVAQALHWFANDAFYQEVKRLIKPNGVFAAIGYGMANITPDVDNIVAKIYGETKPYWAPEREHCDTMYRELYFPFEKITTPSFQLIKQWNLSELLGYLNTWSGLNTYIKAGNDNPTERYFDELLSAWGNPQEQKQITWPLILLVTRIQHD